MWSNVLTLLSITSLVSNQINDNKSFLAPITCNNIIRYQMKYGSYQLLTEKHCYDSPQLRGDERELIKYVSTLLYLPKYNIISYFIKEKN